MQKVLSRPSISSMRFSFWRSRNRFSLDELRYLVEQLVIVEMVTEANKDFVIEALRSIAELITYGDQHDAAYFEYFMEKKVLHEFLRILEISKTEIVSVQLLQTMSIMIQNLKNQDSIHYMFSNGHITRLITYSFDFKNEELLSYYISFIRAVSVRLNRDTISLLVKTQNDELVSFPLYLEAIRFAFHEESMIRTAVRALTLNVYHVGNEAVNRFVSRSPHADYFLNLVEFFRDQCTNLNLLVSNSSKNPGIGSVSSIISTVDEIEDNLYYFSDIVSSGIPDVGTIIMDSIMRLLILPFLLPSVRIGSINEPQFGAVASLFLLCCILRILKIKDLANTVAAALLCRTGMPAPNCEAKPNGYMPDNGIAEENNNISKSDAGFLRVIGPTSNSLEGQPLNVVLGHDCGFTQFVPREALLSFITSGDDVQVSGSLSLLSTILQTKELDESMVDALGIHPHHTQHEENLMQSLDGNSGKEQLFSPESSVVKDGDNSICDVYLQKLKDYYGVPCASQEVGGLSHVHRFQVLDALVSLFCRSNVSAGTLWDGGWLLHQLIHSKADFSSHHLQLLKDSFHHCSDRVLEETKGTWTDYLATVFRDKWIKCKRALEAASLRKDHTALLLPPKKSESEDLASRESSFSDGERMCETVKVFVLLHHLLVFSHDGVLPDHPSVATPVDVRENSRAKNAGLDPPGPIPDTGEINLVDAVSCRIAFEKGQEEQFHFLAVSIGWSGWLVLAEELYTKPDHGIVRAVAPLAGCNPKIDDKHSRWLHLRIRPSSFNVADYTARGKVDSIILPDGRWTVAFQDEESCRYALCMILEEVELQSHAVETSIKPLLQVDTSLCT